ncbi:Gfo/Idh/MocA family oxidoreductase [Paraburkholderia sp. CNPSo 3076]|uniref:Gfo/Idh/MocA family protein n=1 Tax=Paraburkholderia sp. CNPSo 3076 TaxID=2940936 RepID=UPI00225BC9CE|nr:Gfo/Idh/MocA family oxidoreductase [Paraburkholderia sp. CNPSo 3076]MCX5545389.1 Gfo/Idh/MocA family oxidoreductase [Paraburkholderia sp. CNPSo 3076]
MSDINIAVIGAGVIGKRHVQEIANSDQCKLVAIADPSPEAGQQAAALGVALHQDYRKLLETERVDAVIVCTPNSTHGEIGLACIERGIPVLVEKPIADNLASARALAEASRIARVPVLVGHHRRHNPMVRTARKAIAEGRIGKLVAANIMCLHYKPEAYYAVPWRRRIGGGPILINMIHEIDLIRHLCGEIISVQAVSSNRTRAHEVEDSAACTLELDNGAIANISLSDTAATPWSWDTAAGEDRALFDYRPVPTHFFAGTNGALSLPDKTLWSYDGEKGRHRPIHDERIPVEEENVYANQLRHFLDVVNGATEPLIDAHDASQTLAVTLAVVEAARTGLKIDIRTDIRFSSSNAIA